MRRRNWLALYGLLIGGTLFGADAKRNLEAQQKALGTKNSVWVFGVAGVDHDLAEKDGSNLNGGSVMVQIGRGYIGTRWFGHGSVDIISGPYQTPQRSKPKLDHSGTGFSTLWGYNLNEGGIRKEGGSFGLSLGLSYADIVGRSTDTYSSGNETVEQFVMRVSNFAVMPGLFYAWLEKARPNGNKPEYLVTRIEGYLLNLGVAVPFLATQTTKYQSYTPTKPEGTAESQSGRMNGYSIVLNLTTLLGA